MSASAVLKFRFRALPSALGVLAALSFVGVFLAYWVPVWVIWVLATAVVLLVKPQPAQRTAIPE